MIGWQVLNVFFIASHIALILFVLAGWMFVSLRKAHIAVMLITLFSWVVLGLRYGMGYCFWTDWHYAVLDQLGYTDVPSSFVKFLIDSLTGLDHDPQWIDWITAAVFAICLALSVAANVGLIRRVRA